MQKKRRTLYNLLSIEIVGTNRCHINRTVCGFLSAAQEWGIQALLIMAHCQWAPTEFDDDAEQSPILPHARQAVGANCSNHNGTGGNLPLVLTADLVALVNLL